MAVSRSTFLVSGASLGVPSLAYETAVLLVDHSDVLKPWTVLVLTQPRWFYLLIIYSTALMFHFPFLSALLLVGIIEDIEPPFGATFFCPVLHITIHNL